MSFTISSDDATAANAALTSINDSLATLATKPDPASKDLYAGSTLIPIITSASGLAVRLGRALYDVELGAAKAALDPFTSNTTERDAFAYMLSGPKKLYGWVSQLGQGVSPAASEAPIYARLVISILTTVLAAVA